MSNVTIADDEKAARRSEAARKAARTRKRNKELAGDLIDTVTRWVREADRLHDDLARHGVRVTAPIGQVAPAIVPSIEFYNCQRDSGEPTSCWAPGEPGVVVGTTSCWAPGEPGVVVGTLRFGLHDCTITPREGLHPESLAALLGFVKQWLKRGRITGDVWAGWDHGLDRTLNECYILDIVRPFAPHGVGMYLPRAAQGLLLQLDVDQIEAVVL